MRKLINYVCFVVIAIFIHISILHTDAFDIFKEYEKVIWIDQIKQVGIAYQEGKKLLEFPIITGDDEHTTDPGIYVVKLKDANYYSRKYETPMPYSIFFDLKSFLSG
ncbi:MAG: L,D-transpeptidase [Deltaproteobacteria bacterium]|nr:L,D-transpeptidase [Deltaproteobacteria bacterium]